MIHELKDYFYFTKNEKRGIFVLSLLILLSYFLPQLYEVISKPANDAEIEALIRSGICCLPEAAIADTDSISYYGHSYYNDDKNYPPGNPKVGSGLSHKPDLLPVFELNSVDSLDLLSLPGIGPYFAKAILRYRERLGGYHAVNQLLEIWGMDTGKLKRISSHLTVDGSGLKKIGVNTADFKTVMKHPYSNYQIAKALILFRKQFGSIAELEELRKSGIIPDTSWVKLRPYLSLE